MSAYSIEVYMPVCDTCGWEGEPEETQRRAEQAAEDHDAKRHPDEIDENDDDTDPRSDWLSRMDELVDDIIYRGKVPATIPEPYEES